MRRRLVDFVNREDDFRAVLLGSLGFSTTCIADKTGLSHGQVLYRLGKAAVKRADYRNGDSPIAGVVLRGMEQEVSRRLRDSLLRQRRKK
jgi:hypothetical protein